MFGESYIAKMVRCLHKANVDPNKIQEAEKLLRNFAQPTTNTNTTNPEAADFYRKMLEYYNLPQHMDQTPPTTCREENQFDRPRWIR